jgi:hypothetical protein
MAGMSTCTVRPTFAPIARKRFAGLIAAYMGGAFGGRGVPISPVSRFRQQDTC